MPTLRIDVAGQVFAARLPEGPVRIGSDPACEIRIDDPDVSAVHATIEPLPEGGHKLIDANSGRPTLVGGLVVKRVLLKSGDAVEIGPARLTYVVEGVPLPPAARAPVATPRAAAVPAVPAAVAPSPAAVPAAVPPKAAVPPARAAAAAAEPASSPAASGSAGEAPAPAPTVTPAVRAARARSGKRLSVALSALAGFAVLAILASGVLSSGDDPTRTLKSQRDDLERADDFARAGDYTSALELYDRLSGSSVAGIASNAQRNATYLRKTAEDETREFRELEERSTRIEPADVSTAYDRLVSKYGPASAGRHADVRTRVEEARGRWAKSLIGAAREAADAAVAQGRFSEAVSAWSVLAATASVPEEARAAARAGAGEVEQAAASAERTLEDKAAAVAKESGPREAARFLRERIGPFAGTAAARVLADRSLAYQAQSSPAGAASTPSPTGTATPPQTHPPTPEPTAGGGAGRLAALVAEADAKEKAKRWREAVKAFEAALDFARAAGAPEAKALDARRGDAALAAEGVALLATTVREHPERFGRIELAAGLAGSVAEVDEEHVTLGVPGGRTKLAWTSLDAARVTALVEPAVGAPKDALPLAGLLFAAGAKDAAEALLARVVAASEDRTAAFAALARMRREAVPAGGYVVFEKRLVSPAERDRLLLEAKIATAAAKVTSKDAAVRAAAYSELRAMGAPARAAFAAALRSRRAAAVQEVRENKAFTSPRTRQRLQQELEERRAAALALIENASAYPYPNPTHQGQDEVDRLVARVREVWDTPFDVVAGWDKQAAEALAVVTEVDDVLATVEDGYAGDLAGVKAAISSAIDVPGISPDEYSRKVLAFNLKVGTTADPEEKDDVLAVNEYRIMLGRPAVKIHERLVRAARGHSIEMRVKDYFAHESPTPGLESPQKRAAREGYNGGVGENIAMASGTLAGRDAFDLWAHSSGHHRNMVAKPWTEMGAGRCLQGTRWTQVFGAQTGHNLSEPEALPPPSAEVAPEPDPDAPPGTAPPPGRPGKGRGKGRVPDKPPPSAPPPDGTPPDPGAGMGDEPAMGFAFPAGRRGSALAARIRISARHPSEFWGDALAT